MISGDFRIASPGGDIWELWSKKADLVREIFIERSSETHCLVGALPVKVAAKISSSELLFIYIQIKISNFNHFDFTFPTN